MSPEMAAEVAALLEEYRDGLGVAIKAIAKGVLDDLKAEAADAEWQKGDRAFIEVEVTGNSGNNVNAVIVGKTGKGRGISIPANILTLEAVE